MAEMETEQIEVFSPEQKQLFNRLMGYLTGGSMYPGGSYQLRSPRVINNAFSSFSANSPWRGISQTGNIPSMGQRMYRRNPTISPVTRTSPYSWPAD